MIRDGGLGGLGRGWAFALIFATAFVFPVLLRPGALIYPASNLGTDIALRHWPDISLYERMLQQGVVPLWDASILLGRPLAGDTDSLWLYLPSLVVLAVPPALAFNLLALFHVALAGGLAYVYFSRALGLTHRGALVGASAFMFWDKFVAHVTAGHVGLSGAAALVPLAAFGAHRAFFDRQPLSGITWISLALAGQLVAHPQIFVYTVLVVTLYALSAGISVLGGAFQSTRPLSYRELIRPGLWLVLAGGATFVVSAAALLPALELLPHVSRQGFNVLDAARYSLPPILAVNLVLPPATQFPEWTVYPGALPLVLSGIALTGRRRRIALLTLALVAVAWLYSLGPATPLFHFGFRWLPGFDLLRVPPRIWLLAGLALAFVTGLGVETLAESDFAWEKPIRLMLWSLFVILGLGLLSTLVWPWVDSVKAGIDLLALGLVAVLAAASVRGRLGRKAMDNALVGLITLSGLVASWRFLSWIRPNESFLRPLAELGVPADVAGTERWYAEMDDFPYALAASQGIEVVQAVQSFQLAAPAQLISLAAGCQAQGYTAAVPACLSPELGVSMVGSSDPSARLMGLLNVRWLLRAHPPSDPGWVAVAGHPGLFENSQFLPRAFVVGEALQIPAENVLSQLSEIDPSTTALLTDRLPGPLMNPENSGSVGSLSYRNPQSLDVAVRRDSPGLLIVSMAWTPGWQAELNGSPVPVYRVDHALLGVYLPAGDNVVRLRYDPAGWRWGRWVSLIGLAGLLWRHVRAIRRNEVEYVTRDGGHASTSGT